MLLLTLLTSLLASLIYRFYLLSTLLSPLQHIPKASPDWRFSLYAWLYTEPDPIRIAQWVANTPHNGLIRYPGIGGAKRVAPLTSAAVQDVLATKAYASFARPALARARFRGLLGNGLLSVDDAAHKTYRKKLAPAFVFKHVRELYPVFWAKARELIAGLGDGGGHVDLRQWTSRAALDIIGTAAWGRDFRALADPGSELVRRYSCIQAGSARAQRQGKMIYAAALVVPMSVLVRWFPCEFFQNLAAGKAALRSACAEALRLKRDAKQEARGDILDMAMKSEAFTEPELIDHLLTILIAGHETSSLALTWACYLLSLHPSIQTRLRAEIRAAIPSPAHAVSADVLENMPLLRAVSREAMRVIPAVPLVRREASTDTSILNYRIPKGTSVVPMSWLLHKSAKEWGADAAQFKPERWLEDASGGARSTFSDVSFSTGPRSCIGEGFAKGENLALLAAVVGRFEVRLAEGCEAGLEDMGLIWGITVKPTNLRFRMRVVEGWE